MVGIRNRRLLVLIGFPCFPALSSFAQYAQYGFSLSPWIPENNHLFDRKNYNIGPKSGHIISVVASILIT